MHHYISEDLSEDRVEPRLMRTFLIDNEDSSSGCDFSRNGKYNVERAALVDTMLIQKEIHNPKKTSGGLDRITSSGCEMWNGKYTAKEGTVVEMIHMDNDGKEVAVKVDKGALRVAKSVAKDKVVSRHDELKLAAHASRGEHSVGSVQNRTEPNRPRTQV
nr:PREDICTED: uncharacterized protein LOC108218099 [Daucus carota subsp. sativus]